MVLTQTKYVIDLLKKMKLDGAIPISTPMCSSTKLHQYDGEPFSDPAVYKSIIGALKYLSFTRPDISYTVNTLNQFLHSPTVNNWEACKRALKYLKGFLFYSLKRTYIKLRSRDLHTQIGPTT